MVRRELECDKCGKRIEVKGSEKELDNAGNSDVPFYCNDCASLTYADKMVIERKDGEDKC